MFVVLAQWILEAMFGFVDLLRPLLLICAAENPTFHIFGFHHKHTKAGNDDVINLGGTIFGRYRDVFDQVVIIFIQK